ncbi:MAG: thiamine-phosphate kinase [Thermoplasmata archaeon]|nr:MAG: thiamine-phosphate kinase [Thermoplasmata archaeon]
MAKRISSLGEAGVVDLISGLLAGPVRHPRLLRGIGDDCALIRPGRGLLFTDDAFIEGIHFQQRRVPAKRAGWKALAANVSDIAAGGGTPLAALVSLELPPSLPVPWLKAFYAGVLRCARRFSLAVAGGNIARGTKFAAHIALTGDAPARYAGRGGARVGDLVAVTGSLGASRAGLMCLERGLRSPEARGAVKRHLIPEPRVAAGRALARVAGAMIDVSDGLIREAGLIARASKVNLALVPGAVPVHEAAVRLARKLNAVPAALALASGEEYELLACVPRRRFSRAARALARLNLPFTAIGEVRRGRGVTLVGGAPGKISGFDHFR